MEVGSTNSVSNAALQTAEARQSQQAARAERQEPRPPEQNEQQQAPKPVVNAQGQTTGTRINITA